MAYPQRLKAFVKRAQSHSGLCLDVVVECGRGQTYTPSKQVLWPPEPGGTDIFEGHLMILVAYFAFNAAILNLNGDTARVGKILRVETEDRNIAFVQFENDSVRMLIKFVSNNKDCGRHCSTLGTFFYREQEQEPKVHAPASTRQVL